MRIDHGKRYGRRIALAAALLVAAGALFALGLHFGGKGGQSAPQTLDQFAAKAGQPGLAGQAGGEHDHGGDEIAYWTCSMHPWIHKPGPGKCPICSMDLIPVMKKQGQSGQPGQSGRALSLREASLSPDALALAKVETTPVARRDIDVDTRLMGKVEYDETRQAFITAWTGGRLDKLYVDYVGQTVSKGQKMAEIYSPEVYAAQAELLAAIKASSTLGQSGRAYIRDDAARTVKSSREKLRLLGFGPAMIDAVIASGRPSDHVTLTAPIGGVVIAKDVLEGQYVMTGTRLFSIADLDHVWITLQAYESDQPWIRMGAEVLFEAEGVPGKTFSGKAVFIDPVLDDKTRTFRVRLDAPNPGGELKPNMLARAVQRAPESKTKVLAVPASAVLLTGKRALVYVAVPDNPGVFEGREIVLGPRAGDWYAVEWGLREGESVVSQGSFAIDSSAQLEAKPSMMNPESGEPSGGMAGMAGMKGMDQPEKAGQPAREMNMAPRPPAFLAGVATLAPAFQAIDQAVAQAASSGDIQRYRSTSEAFFNALMKINPTGLAENDLLQWKELSMLLADDAVIGRETNSVTEARWQLAEMDGHMKRLAKVFPVPNGEAGSAAGTMSRPEPLAPMPVQHAIAALYKAYLPVQEALAKDDGPGAVAALAGLSAAFSAVDAGSLSGAAATAWKEGADQMKAGLATMTQAAPKDIEAVRKGFYPFSQGLAKAVSTLGSMGAGEVYEIFCPMAFDGAGAIWLSPDPVVRNP